MINRAKLVNIVYDRLSGQVTRQEIKQILDLVLRWFSLKIINEEHLIIPKFGSFSVYKYSSHLSRDLKGNLRKTKEFLSVRFFAHCNLQSIIDSKKNIFRGKNE